MFTVMRGVVRVARVLVLGLALVLAAVFVPGADNSLEAQTAWPSRIVYNMYATDGWVTMADGVPTYIYGFVGGRAGEPLTYQNYTFGAAGGAPKTIATGAPTPTAGAITPAEMALAGKAQLPGPVLYARTGDIIEVRLKNLGVHVGEPTFTPNDPHTIHWHGIDQDAAMDGVPETSLSAIPANAIDPGAGNVIVYEFTVNEAGTYFYHCHQEASIHIRMGMYGALVIYNPRDAAAATGPGYRDVVTAANALPGQAVDPAGTLPGFGSGPGRGGTLYGHKYDAEYIMLLTEVDPGQNNSELAGAPGLNAFGLIFNVAMPMPAYWLVNGISFPNTIHTPSLQGAGFLWDWWAPAHKGYETFYQGSANARYGRGEKVLIRMINIGFEAQPMHIHGFHPKIIGMDQRPWTWSNPPGIGTGQGLEMNTPAIFAGQSMELIIDFGVQRPTGDYATGTYSKIDANGNPVLNTDPNGLLMPDPFISTIPGRDMEPGPTVPNLFPWHNHDDYKATNFGLYPGGQFVMIKVLP